MQPAALGVLEFDRIREAVARDASTSLGRKRALALEPATDLAGVRHRLDLTLEAAAYAKAGGRLVLEGPDDLADVLDALEIADQPLLPLQLLGLARFASSVASVVDGVRAARSPLLADLTQHTRSFIAECDAVRRAIEPSGDVADTASPALADIRDALRRSRAKLRATLDGLTRGRDTAKYLQDQIVTDRNGRYVIVVRSEHREAIPGIVHGASASGASLYVEPMATVSLNNDVVTLTEREKAEVHRILLALTDAFRARDADLAALVAAAADLDELCAKVRFARRVDGIAPDLTSDGHLEFKGARHPLLIPAVRDALAEAADAGNASPAGPPVVIASDLAITPPARALVISGPNTGGKTVALKAFGLLSVMAQSGLLIPVESGSRLTPFRSVFADIGDDQSIAASLSTFSGHVANLVAIDRNLELPALVLLDEIGGGTDPIEGGALGAAVIDHFRRRGALVVATTHDDALKSYAATTEGVAVAAFGFHPETFAPTYTLRYGAPGRSLAIEIARRLGMPASVIADAEQRKSGRESLLAAHLARVDHELASAEEERRTVREERERLMQERRALLDRESRLTEREAVLKKRLEDKVADRLREARAEVDAVVTRLKHKAEALGEQAEKRAQARAPVLTTGEVGGLRAEARGALQKIEAVLTTASGEGASEAFTEPPAIGQAVLIAAFGAEGIVRGISGREVDVEVRGKRMRVRIDGLRKAPGGGVASRPGPGGSSGPRASRGSGAAAALGTGPAREIVLVGSTVDAAIDRLEKFVDDALLSDERRLRVVHGHGTGRLRDAVRTFFKGHPLVAEVSPAPQNEGGDGATIVELKD
jgi:DNA mismatch repair protein MutS2